MNKKGTPVENEFSYKEKEAGSILIKEDRFSVRAWGYGYQTICPSRIEIRNDRVWIIDLPIKPVWMAKYDTTELNHSESAMVWNALHTTGKEIATKGVWIVVWTDNESVAIFHKYNRVLVAEILP